MKNMELYPLNHLMMSLLEFTCTTIFFLKSQIHILYYHLYRAVSILIDPNCLNDSWNERMTKEKDLGPSEQIYYSVPLSR